MENIYKNLHTNQKILIYEMLKRGIDVEVLDEKKEIIRTSYKGHIELICDRDSSIVPYNLSILAGDKGFTKKLLMENGITVPIGEVFKVTDVAFIIKAFEILNCPVVIKPIHGSHGFDVYSNLKTKEEILEALGNIIKSRGTNTEVLIEEYYEGKEYRVFVTKNRDYAVLHRDPAHVYGDGKSSIKQLIEKENYRRMNPRVNALCEILIDTEMLKYLSSQNLTLDSVIENNKKVYVRPNSNVATGGVCEDYTDKVHPSVIDNAMKVIEAFKDLPYVGVDYMTNNITEEQNDKSYRIIEVNTIPGMHMHYRPAVGQSRNIAKYIVDLIYPETKSEE